MPGPIPIIDMRHAFSRLPRQLQVLSDSVCEAAETHGFMLIQNHGISGMLIENILHQSRRFHEWEMDDKRDLPNYTSPVIEPWLHPPWMDCLELQLGPVMRGVPGIFGIGGVIDDWDREMMRIGKRLMEFLCDGLGIHSNTLEDLGCLESRWMNANYFPHGPQNLGLAVTPYREGSVLKIITQGQPGGLEFNDGEVWHEISGWWGGLLVCIGDPLQVVSQGYYRSPYQQVLSDHILPPPLSVSFEFRRLNWRV